MKKLLVLLALALPALARGAELPTEPILKVETGMHTAPVWGADTDVAGKFLVTGSDDKTIRIWDLATGGLLRTIRLPIDHINQGKITAVSISPDAKLVAAGGSLTGPTGSSIYVLDRATGLVVRRLAGRSGTLHNLTFSRDGRRMAAVFGAGELQVFGLTDGQELMSNADCGNRSFGVDFDASGRLVTSCYDGFLRLYDTDLNQARKVRAPGGDKPINIRFSPDGKRIAVGYLSPRVDVLSAATLSPLYSPDTAGLSDGSLSQIAWSADGAWLYAAGSSKTEDGQNVVRRWSEAGRAAARDFTIGSQGSVTNLATLPGRRLVFATGESVWGVLEPDGQQRLFQKMQIIDFRLAPVRLSPTGTSISFSYQPGLNQSVLFSAEDRTLSPNVTENGSLTLPVTEALGFRFTRKSGESPVLDGKPLLLTPTEGARSHAIAPDGESILLGTNWNLRSFDRTGRERWRVSAPAVTWKVNLSRDGRLAVAAFADGTIRWYRAEDGQELLSFFPHADRKRWVAWTPSGYYDASVGGEELIGWHVNRGPDEAADFFPASQFRDRFYRPSIVARVLTTRSEDAALALDETFAKLRSLRTEFPRLLPPVVTLLSPRDEVETRETSVAFRVAVRSPSGEPVTAVRAYVDGRPAADTRGLVFEPDPGPVDPVAERTYTFSVPVPRRDCTVAIAAETRLATSEPVPVKVRWAAPEPVAAKPTLFLLAVGVGAYANPAFKLDLSAKDAHDVTSVWKRQEGGLYGKVETRTLTDKEATKDAILSGLEWLETRTTQKDVAVLFFAGHGINDPRTGEYLFLPHEADLASRRVTLLPHREVLSALAALPGKVLVFLDTCHSGNLLGAKTRDASDLTRLLNEMASAESGLVVFSATTGRGLAQETKGWENGAFTKALLEALGGKADQDGDRSIWIAEIETYLGQRVRELTGGLQTPATAKPDALPDFPVAVTGQR